MDLQRAIEIAVEAHKGQFDKAGAPYILHPLRVMQSLDTENERIVAVLHDVVEDGPGWTFERLEAEGFSPEVIAALELVTKRVEDEGDHDETYLRFVRRALTNPIARRVKAADIRDNLDLKRLVDITDRHVKRLKRYRRALAELEVLQLV